MALRITLPDGEPLELPARLSREQLQHYLERISMLAVEAGHAILPMQPPENGPDETERARIAKAADLKAHGIIADGLNAMDTGIEILSEEDLPGDKYMLNLRGRLCWVVDPLDNSAGFGAHNDAYSINIALVYDGIPILGAVYVPSEGVIYRGNVLEQKAEKAAAPEADSLSLDFAPIKVRQKAPEEAPIGTANTNHSNAATEEVLDALGVRKEDSRNIRIGSTYRGCLIAEGRCDFSPRTTGWNFYDPAAMYGVLLAAGGGMQTLEGKTLRLEGHGVPFNVAYGGEQPPSFTSQQVMRWSAVGLRATLEYAELEKKAKALESSADPSARVIGTRLLNIRKALNSMLDGASTFSAEAAENGYWRGQTLLKFINTQLRDLDKQSSAPAQEASEALRACRAMLEAQGFVPRIAEADITRGTVR